MAYRPTSLDFINRPNPVEPHTDPHKHPLNNEQNYLRLLHDGNSIGTSIGPGEPQRKRRKSLEATDAHLPDDLGRPTLPAVRQQGEKRLRIPPTLSGLHQPPPDAGILPSISANGLGVEMAERNLVSGQQGDVTNTRVTEPSVATRTGAEIQTTESPLEHKEATCPPAKSRKATRKWSDSETNCLLKGVEKHGIGNWTKILRDPMSCFDVHRTALDLKDRFRVCCPDQYKPATKPKASASTKTVPDSASPSREAGRKRSRTSHRKSAFELKELGIAAPVFARSQRRQRTRFTTAEDQAILRGFRKYGNKWLQMQSDATLGLGIRTPMDLRDRMRNRWPEEYAKAGLKLGRPKDGDRSGKENASKEEGKSGKEQSPSRAPAAIVLSSEKNQNMHPRQPERELAQATIAAHPHIRHKSTKTTAPAPFVSNDVFWGLPLDTADDERITLDRRILDWPLSLDTSTRSNTGMHVDSLLALNLPRPSALAPGPSAASGNASASVATAGTLPSLAVAVTGIAGFSGPSDFGGIYDNEHEHLELPSLLDGFGEMADETTGGREARSGGLGVAGMEEGLG